MTELNISLIFGNDNFIPIIQIGGESTFLPSAWQSCKQSGSNVVWSIPWVADVGTIYYRRDLLQQAGIDEDTAFKTLNQLIKTLDCLQKNGVEIPLAIPTVASPTTIQVLASWVWGSGGHFISSSGHHLRFNEPRTKEAITTYFKLYNYLAPPVYKLYDDSICKLFCQGNVAVITGGYWVLQTIKQGNCVPEVANNLGMAMMPGVPFVGGSNLVVWKYSHQTTTTLKLIRYLISRKTQKNILPQCG